MNKTRVPTLTTFIQHSTGGATRAIRRDKEINSIQIRNKQVKLSLLVDDMALFIENPKDSTKKTVGINQFRKVAEYKINTQKVVVFLQTNKKTSEKEIKPSHSQQHKTKKFNQVKNLYSVNYNTLMRKIEDTNGKISLFMDQN